MAKSGPLPQIAGLSPKHYVKLMVRPAMVAILVSLSNVLFGIAEPLVLVGST